MIRTSPGPQGQGSMVAAHSCRGDDAITGEVRKVEHLAEMAK
jgi:hypothetical protein